MLDERGVEQRAHRSAQRRAREVRHLQRLGALELLDSQFEAVEKQIFGEMMLPGVQHANGVERDEGRTVGSSSEPPRVVSPSLLSPAPPMPEPARSERNVRVRARTRRGVVDDVDAGHDQRQFV